MEDIFGYILKLKSRLDVCLSGLLVKIFIVLLFEASNDLSQKLLYHHLYTILTVEEERVIIDKATEIPFIGEYDNFYKDGTFVCRRCNSSLFSSKRKFGFRCRCPSFDESFPNAIKRVLRPDRIRTELQC